MAKDSRPWLKITVDFVRHPKVLSLTMRQRWALLELWSYAMEYRTDGLIIGRDLRRIASRSIQDALLDAGFLAPIDVETLSESRRNRAGIASESNRNDDGIVYELHDFLQHQMSAAELEQKTNQRRSAGRKSGEARRAKASQSATGRSTSRSTKPERMRAHAHARSEEEKEGENNTSSAAADTYVPRERGEQPQPFSDGWVPPEPPADDPPPTRGSLALVHDATPAEISAHTHRTPAAVSDSARTLVRLHAPAGIPRTIQKQLAAEVDKLARDRNVDRADIDAGLEAWARRPDAGPRLLPNLVADAARQRAAATSKPVGIGKPTEKAASIHAAGQALINELRKNQ